MVIVKPVTAALPTALGLLAHDMLRHQVDVPHHLNRFVEHILVDPLGNVGNPGLIIALTAFTDHLVGGIDMSAGDLLVLNQSAGNPEYRANLLKPGRNGAPGADMIDFHKRMLLFLYHKYRY